tara:strand:- start:81 stop:332 length:252 start_codon:yes stop_codon:yes gene_type:complete
MNKHIELVKKWLPNPDSVTQKELRDNRTSAAKAAAKTAAKAAAKAAADDAADDAAAYAAYAAYAADAYAAAVKFYEELKEQGE